MTLSTAAERARTRSWAKIDYLLDWTLWHDRYGASPTSITLYLADRHIVFTTAGVPTQQYVGLVQDWGQIGDALNPIDGELSIGALQVRLANAVPIAGEARIGDLFRLGSAGDGYDVSGSEATLRLVFRGQNPAADAVQLFRLVGEEVTAATPESVTVAFSSIELGLEDRVGLERITTDRFPLAAPSAVGQRIPLLFGTVRQVPGQWIKAGVLDRLRDPITAISPVVGGTLPLSTPDKVANLVGRYGTGIFVVQVDLEQIQVDQADAVAATLRVVQRGYNHSAVGDHARGAEVTEVLDQFVCVFGENPGARACAALPSLYMDSVFKNPTLAPAHTINLADDLGDLVPAWLGVKSFVTARFDGTAAVDASAIKAPEEMYYVRMDQSIVAAAAGAVLKDPLYVSGTAPNTGWTTPCGPDGSDGDGPIVWGVLIRWNIAALTAPKTLAQVMIGRYDTAIYGHQEPAFGTLGWRLQDWNAPLTPAAAGAALITGFYPVMTPSAEWEFDQLIPGTHIVSVTPITDAFNALKAAGKSHLVLLLTVSEAQPASGAPTTHQFYPVGAINNGTKFGTNGPNLFFAATTGGPQGALTRRPAGGQSGSAAEAALGVVTADIVGLSGTVIPLPTKVALHSVLGHTFTGNRFFPTATFSGITLDAGVNYLEVVVHEAVLTSGGDLGTDQLASITYNGVALTRLTFDIETTGGQSFRTYVYGLANPPVGGAYALVVNHTPGWPGVDGGYRGVVEILGLTGVAGFVSAVTNKGVALAGLHLSVSTTLTATGGRVLDHLTTGLLCAGAGPSLICPELQAGGSQELVYLAEGQDVIDGLSLSSALGMTIGGSSRVNVVGAAAMTWIDGSPAQGDSAWVHVVLEFA